MLIVTTATLGMLLVGVLAISMTPDRSAAPDTAASTISGLRTVPATATAIDRPALPMVTPLGDDGWAVTTMSAFAGRTGSARAQLPSGAVVDVEIVATDRAAGLTVVSLPGAARDGYDLAGVEPAPTDTVLVHGDPPQVVTMAELAALDVDEATPVLDAAGDLIGLCANGRDGVALRTVATMPGDSAATTIVPTTSGASTATTVVTATTADRSTTTSTSTTTTIPGSTASTSTTPATTQPPSSAPDLTGGDDATTAPG